MRLTCAIIDDEPLAVSLLESYVLKTPFLDLQGTYNSALDALSDLRDRPVDLLFLDIQMSELSGLEFSRILNADIPAAVLGNLRVVGDEDNRASLGVQALEEHQDLERGTGIQVAGSLIRKDHRRIVHQGTIISPL
jgi:DNA-binding NarL/FixJ family response regulator